MGNTKNFGDDENVYLDCGDGLLYFNYTPIKFKKKKKKISERSKTYKINKNLSIHPEAKYIIIYPYWSPLKVPLGHNLSLLKLIT